MVSDSGLRASAAATAASTTVVSARESMGQLDTYAVNCQNGF